MKNQRASFFVGCVSVYICLCIARDFYLWKFLYILLQVQFLASSLIVHGYVKDPSGQLIDFWVKLAFKIQFQYKAQI